MKSLWDLKQLFEDASRQEQRYYINSNPILSNIYHL